MFASNSRLCFARGRAPLLPPPRLARLLSTQHAGSFLSFFCGCADGGRCGWWVRGRTMQPPSRRRWERRRRMPRCPPSPRFVCCLVLPIVCLVLPMCAWCCQCCRSSGHRQRALSLPASKPLQQAAHADACADERMQMPALMTRAYRSGTAACWWEALLSAPLTDRLSGWPGLLAYACRWGCRGTRSCC